LLSGYLKRGRSQTEPFKNALQWLNERCLCCGRAATKLVGDEKGDEQWIVERRALFRGLGRAHEEHVLPP